MIRREVQSEYQLIYEDWASGMRPKDVCSNWGIEHSRFAYICRYVEGLYAQGSIDLLWKGPSAERKRRRFRLAQACRDKYWGQAKGWREFERTVDLVRERAVERRYREFQQAWFYGMIAQAQDRARGIGRTR